MHHSTTLTKIFRELPLWNLPNEEGFEFTGIVKSGESIQCKIAKDDNGSHSVVRKDNNENCSQDLRGWVRS